MPLTISSEHIKAKEVEIKEIIGEHYQGLRAESIPGLTKAEIFRLKGLRKDLEDLQKKVLKEQNARSFKIVEGIPVETIVTLLSDPKLRIEKLDLEGNSVGDDGAKKIAETLKKNTALTQLNLKDNKIGYGAQTQLLEQLKTQNPNLKVRF